MYYAQYERDYGNNTFFDDYYNLFFKEFYIKLYGLSGEYKEIINLRNIYLNGKKTKNNKEEYARGKKLCTPEQIEMKRSTRMKMNTRDLEDYLAKISQKALEQKGLI